RASFLEMLEHSTRFPESVDLPDADHHNAVTIMSIHSAKGLEFPAVIIPECHQSFNFSYSDPVIVSSERGLGLSVKSSQKTATNLLRSGIISELTETTIAEEKRIFYVACTRAKDRLLVTGTRLKALAAPKSLKSFLDFVLSIGTITYDPLSITFRFDSQPQPYPLVREFKATDLPSELTQLRTSAASSTNKKTWAPLHTQECPARLIRLSVTNLNGLLSCPKKFHYRHLISKIPQDLEKESSHADSLDPRQLGSLVHEVFKYQNQQKTPLSTERISRLVRHSFRTDKQRQKAEQFIAEQHLRYVESPVFAAISEAQESYFERPFALQAHQLVIEGRFDAVIKHGKSWRILDFKTDYVNEADNIDGRYLDQMTVYALALKHLFNASGPIEAILYYTRSGKSIAYTIDEAQLLTLSKKIESVPRLLALSSPPSPDLKTCQACPMLKLDQNCPTQDLDPD
ncbi:MAG: ATP-dependent exoDNAse (exonuclease V) beta subunit, partial [Candidatus Marinamargulisbacteria bacterium]